jgi:cobalamin biosynthesis Mg chelatase CobN
MMADPRSDRPIVETTTEAREGSTPGVTRYVLIVGTALVIICFLIIVLVIRS